MLIKIGYYNTIDGFMFYSETTKENLEKDIDALYQPLMFLRKQNLIKKFGTCVVAVENDKIIFQCGSL